MKSVHKGDPRTLKALFLGELWRGRDNMRVSLRGPLDRASAPSVAFPILYLAGLGAVLAGALLLPIGGWPILAAGAGLVFTLTLLRTAALLWPSGERSPGVAVQAMLVGAVYDTARALALVTLAGHGLRRKS
jgi:hypothetical protein